MQNVYRIILEPNSGVNIDNIAKDAYELAKTLHPLDGICFTHNDRVYRAYLTWSEDTKLTESHFPGLIRERNLNTARESNG